MRWMVPLVTAGLVRSPLRTLIRILVVCLAVALLGSMLLFIGDSLTTMTSTAVRSVPLDWQGPVGSYRDALHLSSAVGRQAGIQQAAPAATAPFAGMEHVATVGTIRSAPGAILAVSPDYLQHFQTLRFLHGGLVPGRIVLDQQLAATLQAQVGDHVTLFVKTGAKPLSFVVGGVALATSADTLFQPLNPLLGPAPAQPPAEIAVLPLSTFADRVAPLLPTISGGGITGSAVPGVLPGTQWQVQAQVAPGALSGGPTAAAATADQIRNRVERVLTGQIRFVDNLSNSLSSAAGDALYAQALYIMLAIPGALIALGLAYLAALGTIEADRRDLALMRARGAARRDLLTLAGVESLLTGAVSGAAGVGLALLAVATLVHGGISLSAGRAAYLVIACIALGILGSAAARIGATVTVYRSSVLEARGAVLRQHKPLWERLYLDLLALAISGLIYWLTARTGFSAVVNPDSNPTLSLSVYMFFGPALLWVGATLLLVRLRGGLLRRLGRRATAGRAATVPGFLLASAGRRGAAINRGLIVLGLLLAFGVNLGIFTATYDQQALVDAQLTIGADVVATAPPGVISGHALERTIAGVPGVSATTPLDHSYAYVGPDLQDTFGIDAVTFGQATSLRDSYFPGSSAAQVLARLRATPDGLLVSKETITDYQLRLGDLLRLRVLDHASGQFRIVPFHVVGTVAEFPSAPKDSFMVGNLSYLLSTTHDPGPNAVFVKTSGDVTGVARRVAGATAVDGTTVHNISTQTASTVSSITTVDLTGISRIEELFIIILAAAAMILYVTLALGERRHEFASMAALGASRRVIGAFLWSEVALIIGLSLLLAVGLGWLLSAMLVAMLSHVFDPPPDAMAIPWRYLLELGGATLVTAAAAMAYAAARLRHMPLGRILREQ
jgi:putative ABC transport system permease protein